MSEVEYFFNETKLLIGRSGHGRKVHLVEQFTNVSGIKIEAIYCGSAKYDGSGYGMANKIQKFDKSKITCQTCLKRLVELERKAV